MPRNRHLQWKVRYEPGVLEAVAYKKGTKLTSRVETTGTPYEVVLNPSKTTMYADGTAATVMNISVVDKEGREVPDANNLIRFTWTGDAKVIGVGNGNPSTHEPDKSSNDTAWQRRLFKGKCQVILQAGQTESIIKFQAFQKVYSQLLRAFILLYPISRILKQAARKGRRNR
jgi:beta-galactosidase